MPSPLDKLLLRREFPVPGDDDSPPAFLELGDAFVSINRASTAQIRLCAKLHETIAERHLSRARRLREFAERRAGDA